MPDGFDPNEAFEVRQYDPTWPQKFHEERERLEAALGDDVIDIKHVGSTSVPGLSAKPTIDLLVAVECFAPAEHYTRLLAPLGYHHHAHEADHDRLFFWKGSPRSHHVHIVEFATWEHQRHVIFRDYLRRHPEVAQEYEKIKRELATLFKTNRPAYTRGKTAFIKNIMARAVEEILDPSLRRLVEEAQGGEAHTEDAPVEQPQGDIAIRSEPSPAASTGSSLSAEELWVDATDDPTAPSR